jgi:hypothetical protein
MKRYVKLFESYVREYAEHQQPDFPEAMHGYEGSENKETEGSDDPVEIALNMAQDYGVDPAQVEETIAAIQEEEGDEYGVMPMAEGLAIMATVITGLVSVSFLGAHIEGILRNKRWLKAEIEGRLEALAEENPELVEEDKEALMRAVTDEVMNDPEIAEKLAAWKKDGGAPVHKRHRGPVYTSSYHSFGSGSVGRS